MRCRWRRYLTSFARTLLLSVIITMTLFPIVWLLGTSVKIPRDYYARPPVWFPRQMTLDHYKEVISIHGIGHQIKNSFILAAVTSYIVVCLTVPAAFGIVRYKTGGKNFLLWILSHRMLPPVSIVLPLFVLYTRLGLVDSYTGLVLVYIVFNIPLSLWLLYGFLADFPMSLYEQALVDGCSEMGALVRVMLPLVSPMIVVVVIFCFVSTWNELMLALTLTGRQTQTLMVIFTSTLHSPLGLFYGQTAAIQVIAMVPALLLTVFAQRYLVRGLTLGAVKG